ncbi:MAG: PhnD/SsuA/transferrin family substrate-binding protein [Gemmataceae bacterium]|nr:PhnD/SsuA/transferrin family substrate-binding protein [Gemmataceae bacterium]
MFWFYEFLAHYLGGKLGCTVELAVGASYDELAGADVAFVCSLPYVELAERGNCPVVPIAAPVLRGRRYGGKAVYFSDVIVRGDSPCRSFADLRGRSWAYNEPHSQSGYGVTRYFLARCGETRGYFGRVVEAGWHERSVRMVCDGAVDASAIDSHVLALMMRDDPALSRRVRVIHSLGPSTIQPVVAARRLPARLKSALRRALVTLADGADARGILARALVERFVPVRDSSYDDVRDMRLAAQRADFMTLR